MNNQLDPLESYYPLGHVLETYDGLCIMFGTPSQIHSVDDHYHALDIVALIHRCAVARPDSKDREDYIERWEDFALAWRQSVNKKQ